MSIGAAAITAAGRRTRPSGGWRAVATGHVVKVPARLYGLRLPAGCPSRLLAGCLASFIGSFLGSTYGAMLLIAGFAPWEEGATAGVLVLGSVLAFTSGFRTWRYFRSL